MSRYGRPDVPRFLYLTLKWRLSSFPTRIMFDVECYSFLCIRCSLVPLQADGDMFVNGSGTMLYHTAYVPSKSEMI